MNICSSSVRPGSNRTHLQARRPLRSDHARSSPPPVVLVTVLHLTCLPIVKTLRPCTPLFHILEPLQHRRNIFNLNRSRVRSGFRAILDRHSPIEECRSSVLDTSDRQRALSLLPTIKANSRMLAFPPPQPAADKRQQSRQASADDGTGGMYRRRVCERGDDIRAEITVGIRAVTHELELEL